MPDDPQGPRKKRTKLWLALAAVLVLIALVVVPPYISLNNYKSRVARSVSTALGRPVRLSEVELRLLPRPGFLLSDLTVESDPAFGAEPILHANTVTASIRFSSLWQGGLQISSISVDEASFNLVRMPDGRWNLESLFQNTAATADSTANRAQPPYMEATNSRINIKDGPEKLPFSLLDADASMSRESNGDWQVRLKGQPARTDVTLDLADTGILRLQATLHPASHLAHMPMHVDMEWSEAQLGQLSRLLLASDEGWRGNLTGELHLDGTQESTKVQSRLRASGVHRAEFAPVAPMDFDATCAFTVHFTQRSAEGLECNSPIGDGHARLTGDLRGPGQQPKLTLDLDQIPAQVALDLLRTMRNTIDPSLQATGSVSGHMTYDPAATSPSATPTAPVRKTRTRPAREPQTAGPFTGAFTVHALKISGDALTAPIQIPVVTLEPAEERPGQPSGLTATTAIPAGGPAPLTVTARLALTGFELSAHGTATFPRMRELAHAAGAPAELALKELAGGPLTLDFAARGPWVPPVDLRLAQASGAPAPRSVVTNGTVTLHDANWKPSFLANAVLIPSATLHLENGALTWDPVQFSYGPVKGTATLHIPADCEDPQGCPPHFTLKFGALDAAAFQAALLGAREKGTLLSTLLERLSPSAAPAWPALAGTVTAESLTLGPFTLTGVTAEMKVMTASAEATSFDAALLGGHIHGTASLTADGKPDYTLEAAVTNVNPEQAGQLASMKWSGGTINANGKIELTGYTDIDLGKSAKGTLHVEWRHGVVAGAGVPAALTRFDSWSGDATVADNGISLKDSEAQRGSSKFPVKGAVTFGSPAKVTFGSATPPAAAASAAK